MPVATELIPAPLCVEIPPVCSDKAELVGKRLSLLNSLKTRLAVSKNAVENAREGRNTVSSSTFPSHRKFCKEFVPSHVHCGWNKLQRWDTDEAVALERVQECSAAGTPSVESADSSIEKSLFASDLSWLDYAVGSPLQDEPAFDRPIALEVFGGCARLTRALEFEGFEASSIDWIRNQSRPVGSLVLLDLTTEHGRVVLKKVIRSGRLAFIHFAPPCGTCSRARDIPLDADAIRRGVKTPQPLRSAEFPNGFPWLSGTDKSRVEQANVLYEVTASCIILAESLGIAWSVENPRSSWFWETTFMRDLVNHLDSIGKSPIWTEFQNCAFGGDRPKWSAFLHNIPLLHELEIYGKCDGTHEHKPWGVLFSGTRFGFATTSEAAYPERLCTVIANIVSRYITSKGLFLARRKPVELSADPTATGMISAEAGRQARGHKAPRLIAEYSGVGKFIVPLASSGHVLEGQILKEPMITPQGVVPAKSKVLRVQANEVGERAFFAALPWSKEKFLDKAKTLVHPVDSTAFLGDHIYENILFVLTNSPSEVKRFRDGQLSLLKKWAKQSELDEKALHKGLAPDAEKILANKSLLVFEKVLSMISHRDTGLGKRMGVGFQLSGVLEPTNEFAKRIPKNKNPVSKVDLLKASSWSRHVIAATVGPSGDDEMDQEIFRITQEEREKGWLKGPASVEYLDQKFNASWLAARRFGVRQGDKVRPIDDFSAHGQNSTVVVDETIPLGGVDAILCLAKWIVGSVGDDRKISIPFKGRFLVGVLHEAWTLESARTLLGRCVDLKSAYKQLLGDPADGAISIIATWNPVDKVVELYESVALPFGSTGSVYGFNRCSFAIRQIFIKHFKMFCTSFFDDYPFLELESLAEHSDLLSREVLSILGWEVSVDKLKPFHGSFDAVGVSFDFQGLPSKGAIVVNNTPKRKESIYNEIGKSLASGFMTSHEAATLRGRMQYGEAQHWSRILSLTTRHLSLRASGIGSGIISGELSEALVIAQWLMIHATPRVLSPWGREECNLIFTDAAAESGPNSSKQVVSVGGVIFSPRLAKPQFFGAKVSEDIVAHWQSGGSKHLIAQGELAPVLISKKLWKRVLEHCRNLFFLDNDSAKEGLIRSFSPSWASREIILATKLEDIKLSGLDWYSRVPTGANYADGPSRLDFSDMVILGAEEVCMPPFQLCDIAGVKVLDLLTKVEQP